jgi:NAD(P)-dependent dehydrogenase (short-subunit alcohol dehydrogenase family)
VTNFFDLTGRVAVVIGGTSGIGRVLALGLARYGADIVPTGRRQDSIERVCAEARELGREALAIPVDVNDRGSIERLCSGVLEIMGRVDILVNAAGFTKRTPTLSVTDEEWSALFQTNLQGTLRACQSFYPALKASGRGRIINIGSLGGYVAFHEVAAYCASKAAVHSLTRSLACEWAQDGISVNTIAPGVFPTELNRALLDGTPRGREILLRTPMRRFGHPEELVATAVLLASDGASFLTGQCIAVDGGFLASGVNS